VLIEGTAPPSAIVSAIEDTGRDAILRGSGAANSAGVCILETHASSIQDPVRGLARMVHIPPSNTLVDLTVRGVSPGQYHVTVRENGDISQGAASTGGIWQPLKENLGLSSHPRGYYGCVEVGNDGKGSVFLNGPAALWEMIGRSMVVSKQKDRPFNQEDQDTLVGVIARSAGVWQNEKTVCSCSGKTIWEERKEQTRRGMM
jgi:copper chaperone for superoxide dismutase